MAARKRYRDELRQRAVRLYQESDVSRGKAQPDPAAVMRLIREHRDQFAIALLPRVLNIGPSTYYAWVRQVEQPRDRDMVDLGLAALEYGIWSRAARDGRPTPHRDHGSNHTSFRALTSTRPPGTPTRRNPSHQRSLPLQQLAAGNHRSINAGRAHPLPQVNK